MAGIQYLKRSEINEVAWDACMQKASNSLIYGFTFYLDAMCTNWDGLVFADYRAVMPLPWRKKWGIRYLYQPFAIAQLGVFGNEITTEMILGFLKKIPATFRYWDMPLNFGNQVYDNFYTVNKRQNYVLNLRQPYSDLYANYRQNLKRNLKKAQTQNVSIVNDICVDTVIALAKKQAANWGTAQDYEHFKKLYVLLHSQNNVVTYAVKSVTGALLAAAVFFVWNGRAYYILPGNAESSRKTAASHFLLDAFIKDHSGQPILLDFEGSDVPGLQFFYSSFGAREEPYIAIRHNRLPRYIRWLKK